MFGKIFESLFTGSMVGAGFRVFAVWSYAIANQRPDRRVGSQVELNPKLLAAIFGESQEDVQKAVDFLCLPDPLSRTPDEDGRRLVRLGQYSYRVVNGAQYREMRNEEERRAQNREAQARFRKKHEKGASAAYLARERRGVRALKEGNEALADEIAAEGIPQPKSDAI